MGVAVDLAERHPVPFDAPAVQRVVEVVRLFIAVGQPIRLEDPVDLRSGLK